MPEPPLDPLPQDPALAAALAQLELGADVPAPLQRAAAAALAWVYAIDREAADGEGPIPPPRGLTPPR